MKIAPVTEIFTSPIFSPPAGVSGHTASSAPASAPFKRVTTLLPFKYTKNIASFPSAISCVVAVKAVSPPAIVDTTPFLTTVKAPFKTLALELDPIANAGEPTIATPP